MLMELLRTHTTEKQHTCTICHKAFSHKGDLLNHERSHTREKPSNCTSCNKAFLDKSNLKDHVKTHTMENSPSYNFFFRNKFIYLIFMFIFLPTFSINTYLWKKCVIFLVKTAWQILKLPGNFSSNFHQIFPPSWILCRAGVDGLIFSQFIFNTWFSKCT